ncbi:hypothetical protein Ddye_026866 [Dipteronia dyeriana]|uniref:RNase H type-1 domain-containing protein n=1 Tax=Dipteronia dyeriana TaxID=168575 RepID=A0AAD9TN68_9ROSI|nr:hypothetical protein Ddye_026866 [Dipteronia dyeriana]
MSRSVWCEEGWQFASLGDYFISCLRLLQQQELEIFCVMLWRIWFHRNQVLYSSAPFDLPNIFSWAQEYLSEFSAAIDVVPAERLADQLGIHRWKAPDQGVFKGNTDAAEPKDGQKVGIRIVVRNAQGMVMGSSTQCVDAMLSPQIIEAMAMLRGIQFAMDSV